MRDRRRALRPKAGYLTPDLPREGGMTPVLRETNVTKGDEDP